MAHKQRSEAEVCLWHQDEEGHWETACDGMWTLTEGTPGDNGMHFCPLCGAPLRWRSYREGRK